MKKIFLLLLSAAAVYSTQAFSQAKTRAQVYQELVAAEKAGHGPDCYNGATYPDVTFACQVRLDRAAKAETSVASTQTSSADQN